ncbi:hypothetical protein NEMBOFW57_002183 [Staphylotrichum longicolle]|uniref:Uncharacterized protein n=1 Tax=Staphylotrichum longicolle TaxID=669026 RepID=A0AAD4F7J0_9PEZI|nr:hypothetical protein NEMBOFW57_002183 [Staphylotrichum longicolle]
MHDAGPFNAAIHSGHHHGSHAVHHQLPVTGHYHAPCPYEDKVTKDGTTARMVLLFLRELLEQLSVAEHAQQSYGCPMTKCHKTFAAPLQVIQHLLSCPELPSGEFDCDKCSTSHSFPTNEKDWSQWMGFRFPHSMHAGPIQRKRSLGSKMKDFALRKKDPSRKQNPGFDPHFRTASAMDTRPSTAASEAPTTSFTSRVLQHHVVFPGQPVQGSGPDYSTLQKPVLHTGLPEVDGSMFWPGFNAGCLKTFSRLDNLKKHKKDKHGIEDTGGSVPAKRDFADCIEEEVDTKRPGTVESELRGATEDYSMLWPAMHKMKLTETAKICPTAEFKGEFEYGFRFSRVDDEMSNHSRQKTRVSDCGAVNVVGVGAAS